MSDKTLIENPTRMYKLVENDSGDYILSVVCGGIAMFEMKIQLTPEEVSSYQNEGESFIERLATNVSKNTDAYKSRMKTGKGDRKRCQEPLIGFFDLIGFPRANRDFQTESIA